MPRKRKPFIIDSREEGRGPTEREAFCSLQEVSTYIQGRWQGIDYMDCPTEFHTDYSSYHVIGFTLWDIGFMVDSEFVFNTFEEDL